MLKTANEKPVILVAPLNWGLGHASRCIPIINLLLLNDCEVIIACGKNQKRMLEAEFGSLRFVELPGYDLKYGKKRWLTLAKIIFQIPKILIQIKSENRWLERFLSVERVDALISDNRYGLYSTGILSVFMTHQLKIKTAFGARIEKIIQRINYKYINRFNQCWVPDFNDGPSLAGELSHPDKLTVTPIQYIGCLSRFKKMHEEVIPGRVLLLLSGPEPQRTFLEELLLQQLKFWQGDIIMVRGMPAEKNDLAVSSNIKAYNHLESSALNKLICQSEFIICRSGYSSVMDIIKLGKKSILIPTPGQSEQEYLADYLYQKRLAVRVQQKEFVLQKALEIAKKFPYMTYENIDDTMIREAVEKFIDAVKS